MPGRGFLQAGPGDSKLRLSLFDFSSPQVFNIAGMRGISVCMNWFGDSLPCPSANALL